MMMLEGNVIIQPDPAPLPFGMDPQIGRQGLQVRRVDFHEHLAAGLSELAHHPHIVEQRHAFGDRGIEFGQAVEDPVAQSAQQPALDDPDAGFDLGLLLSPELQVVEIAKHA